MKYKIGKIIYNLFIVFIFVFAVCSPISVLALPTSFNCTYYISNNGDDEADGKTNISAWATFVNLSIVKSGEKVCLEKNSNWVGRITLNSGIILSDYGEEGYPPRISNPGDLSNNAIQLLGNGNIIENIEIYNCGGSGVYIGLPEAHVSDNIVRNMEISNCNSGIKIYGEHNLIEYNYLHDLYIFYGDKDSGAIAIWLFGSHNKLLYNTIIDSFDYNYEKGGAVEFWASHNEDAGWNEIAYNRFNRTGNVFKFDGNGGYAENNWIHNNVILDPNDSIFNFHMLENGFGISSKGTAFDSNTIVAINSPEIEVMIYWSKVPTPEDLIFINNIVYLGPKIKQWICDNANNNGFYHNYNIYFSLRERFPSNWGYTLFGNGEVLADPLFYDIFSEDYRLLPNSLARGAGNYGLNMGAYP